MVHGIVYGHKEKLSHDIWRGMGTTGNVVLSKIGQTQKDEYCMLSFIYRTLYGYTSVCVYMYGWAC